MAQTASPSKLDLTKPVQTRSGRPVRILATDVRRNDKTMSVIGLVTAAGGEEFTKYWSVEGKHSQNTHDDDLVNVPVTVRVCLYRRTENGIVESIILHSHNVSEDWIKTNYKFICTKEIILDT